MNGGGHSTEREKERAERAGRGEAGFVHESGAGGGRQQGGRRKEKCVVIKLKRDIASIDNTTEDEKRNDWS